MENVYILRDLFSFFKIAKRTEVFRQENGKKNKKKNKIEDYYSSSFF
jgi:hypothetical protein